MRRAVPLAVAAAIIATVLTEDGVVELDVPRDRSAILQRIFGERRGQSMTDGCSVATRPGRIAGRGGNAEAASNWNRELCTSSGDTTPDPRSNPSSLRKPIAMIEQRPPCAGHRPSWRGRRVDASFHRRIAREAMEHIEVDADRDTK